MEIQIQNSQKLPVKTARIRQTVKKILKAEGFPTDVEVSLVLTDDTCIHELNRTYLGHDWVTDVISFPQDEDTEEDMPEGENRVLGDIVVSVDTAKRQADERDKPLDDEIDLLVAHGLLHLLGYDDQTPEDAEKMNAKTTEILGAEVTK